MGEIKLVLTDIDGTIVPHGQHDPTPVVRESILEVQNAGIQLTAATGRPYEMAKGLFQELGLKGLCVFDNEASVRDVDSGELSWSNWLSVDRLKAISAILIPNSQIIDFYPIFKAVPVSEVTIDDVIEPAPYVFAFASTESMKTIEDALKQLSDLVVHVDLAPKDMPGLLSVQITDIGSNKYNAVTALRKLVHSTKEETLAIGDSTNDLFLFENAGTRIAMGNAVEELKAKADYIVGSIDNDGFAEAMHRFVLL